MLKFKIEESKRNFFDRAGVADAVGKATRKALSRFGAFVRTRARTSMRRRKAASKPGSPPSAHVGLIKKFLYFAYDPEASSVVIGPVRLNGVVDPDALPALEYGGSVEIEDRRRGKRREVDVKARPFMGPAFAAELPNAANLWKDSVRR